MRKARQMKRWLKNPLWIYWKKVLPTWPTWRCSISLQMRREATIMNPGLDYFKSSSTYHHVLLFISFKKTLLSFFKLSWRWCRDCVDLFIKIAYPEKEDDFWRDLRYDEKELMGSVTILLPLLGWMKNLKTLSIIFFYCRHWTIFVSHIQGWNNCISLLDISVHSI